MCLVCVCGMCGVWGAYVGKRCVSGNSSLVASLGTRLGYFSSSLREVRRKELQINNSNMTEKHILDGLSGSCSQLQETELLLTNLAHGYVYM